MGRLTRAQAAAHRKALGLADVRRDLTEDEKLFVLTHFQESTGTTRHTDGAFFTPVGLANCLSLDVIGNRVIDLCAGIGALAFACRNPGLGSSRESVRELVCVETNPHFVAIGRKIVPEATWLCADIFDLARYRWRLFDTAIANPPFGPTAPRTNGAGYRGPRFEYQAIAVAARLARYGVFLIPQNCAPFRYSGQHRMLEHGGDAEYRRFAAATGIELDPGCSVDTAYYDAHWHQRPPRTEIVTTDFAGTATAHRRSDRMDRRTRARSRRSRPS